MLIFLLSLLPKLKLADKIVKCCADFIVSTLVYFSQHGTKFRSQNNACLCVCLVKKKWQLCRGFQYYVDFPPFPVCQNYNWLEKLNAVLIL